jgi:YVTN family beta-propeller protein
MPGRTICSRSMAGLPAGTVTLLFTDIEGSTDLLKRLRDRYGEVLAEHERILRAAIEEAGGQIVDTQGDAVFAVFPRARAAVAAAVAAQRALTAEPWPVDEKVRVRMGLHSGEPAVGADRYVGLGVHRAARISAAAHGGQVLLSGVTRELVEDELPGGVRMIDLGEHRLKDIDRPEHLFQLVVDGLQGEFPPLRTGTGDAATVALADAVGRRRFVRSRRSVLGLALGAVLVAAGITAFLLTNGGSSHAALISADSVGFIDARGRVRSQVSVDQAPTAVAYGDGAIWAANSAAGTVSRIDPLLGTLQQTIPVGQSPSGIVATGNGVWVANHDDGTVGWINPQSNGVVKEVRVGAGPTAVAFGFDSVWVTNGDDRTVTRIDAGSGKVTATIHTNAVGRGIVVGGGSVWVTDEATRSVVQIDPATNAVTATATVGAGPTGIAYGDGSVWVANALDGTVSRVDARTLAVQATIQVGDGPSAVAFGSGSVWVGVEFGNRVVRIDPRRGIAIGSTAVGNRPEGLTVAGGGVWLAVQASGTGHQSGRLVILGDTLDSIDPALASSTASSAVLATVYDGLTNTRRVGGSAGTQLVPDLAAALPLPTDRGRSYTFRLRPGIRYSDGRPLRPADFRRALEREIELPGHHAALFSKVLGALRCRQHRPCDLSRGVVASGSSTLTIRLAAPDPRFLLDLALLSPVPTGTPATRDVGTKPVPATGAYAIESYVPGRLLTLVRNHYFHVWSAAARPSGYPDEIVYRPVKSVGSDRAVADVLAGKADLAAETVPNSRVQELAARYPRQLHLDPQQATAFVFLNMRQAPFDDVRVRRALNFAVDRKRVATLHGGALLAQPTCQLVPPTETGYARYCPYTIAADASGEWKAPDLAKARALIAASGTRGQTIVVWSFSYFRSESQYFVAMLRRLGYRARLHYIDDLAGYFGALYKTPSAQAGFVGFFETGIAADMLTNVTCRSPDNYAHFCDPRIDAQVAQLTKDEPSDPAGTAKLAATIDREVTDAAPWVPLFTPRFAELTSARVGNYQYNPSGVLFDQLWVR